MYVHIFSHRNNTKTLIYITHSYSDGDMRRLDLTSNMYKYFDSQTIGLNMAVLIDIYNVHQLYRFKNFHFKAYPIREFKSDIVRNGNEHFGVNFTQKHLENIAIQSDENKLFPTHIINDDMFQILAYHFGISCYANYLK